MKRCIDAKSIRLHVKRHGTTESLMTKYGIESAEELYNSLYRIFSTGADAIISSLQKNDKKEAKKRNATTSANAVNEEETMEVSLQDEPIACELLVQSESQEAEEVVPTDCTSNFDLASLRNEEAELSALQIQKEVHHEELKTARASCISELQKCRTTIVELQRLISVNRARVAEIVQRYDGLADEMKEVSEEISIIREELSSVREKIQIASMARIYIFEDSSIEIENVQIPFSLNQEEDARSLVQYPEAKRLTVLELEAVIKLTRVTAWLEEEKIFYEISFDNPEVQKLYEVVKAESKE